MNNFSLSGIFALTLIKYRNTYTYKNSAVCWAADLVTSSSGARSKSGVWMMDKIHVKSKILQDVNLGIKCRTMM